MKIDDKLIQEGFNESILQFYHNRTKQSKSIIRSASLFNKRGGNHFVKIELYDGNRHRIVCYEMNLADIRQKKLNLFLSK